jgi:hypothetical protein
MKTPFFKWTGAGPSLGRGQTALGSKDWKGLTFYIVTHLCLCYSKYGLMLLPIKRMTSLALFRYVRPPSKFAAFKSEKEN